MMPMRIARKAEVGKGQKPLPHCNHREDHRGARRQISSRLRDWRTDPDAGAIRCSTPQDEGVEAQQHQQSQGDGGDLGDAARQ
jgi:hypothetical protein